MKRETIGKQKRNIKLVIQYDGSAYGGWQRLGSTKGKPSIQNLLEETISKCLKEDIRITASGRTDTGVHALGQTANFHCYSDMELDIMRAELNKNLPEDIKIISAEIAPFNYHSRFSAKSKTYEYFIDNGETPCVFTRKYALHIPETLNLEAMQQGARYLVGTHDYKAFCTDRKDLKSTVRTIESIEISNKGHIIKNTKEQLSISITGDGFLYHMIRIIVGTLLEVGKGSITPEDVADILNSRRRENAGMKVYPKGLFLTKVRY